MLRVRRDFQTDKQKTALRVDGFVSMTSLGAGGGLHHRHVKPKLKLPHPNENGLQVPIRTGKLI